MPSQIYQDIFNSLDGALSDPTDNLEIARAKMNAVHGLPTSDDTEIEWIELNGARCAWVIAKEAKAEANEKFLLYFHGGAFIAADGDGFLFYAEMLSRLLSVKILMVDYRLAPEHPYPAALNDCTNTFLGLLQNGIDANQIGLIGDSCGGGLVISTLLKLKQIKAEMPACGISLCGWFNLDCNPGTKAEIISSLVKQDPFTNLPFIHKRGLDYVGLEANLSNPFVSPIYGDLENLPPLLIQTGDSDPTKESALTLTDNAKKIGTKIQLEIYPDMLHGFQGLANLGVPESLEAIQNVNKFLKLAR